MTVLLYPEHEKLDAVSDRSQAIGEFLEEMSQREGWSLCIWGEQFEEHLHWPQARLSAWRALPYDPDLSIHGPPELRRHAMRDEWLPVPGQISDKLATYFGIDLVVLEAEKRAMLDAIRQRTREV